MAAAMPPSAMTVCALPSSDLQTTAVRAPFSWASIAARRPGTPRPDDDDVVLVPLELHQQVPIPQKNRRSVIVPVASRKT